MNTTIQFDSLWKTFFLSLAGGLFFCSFSFGQDIHFSQFDETPLQLNPADAGVHDDIRVVTNYKNQWQVLGSPYKTFALSTDARLLRNKKNHMGLGLDLFSDNAGNPRINTVQANLSFSGIIALNDKSVISGGLMAGLAERSINSSELQWGSQYNGLVYNAALPTNETILPANFSFLDLGAGVQYSYSNSEMYISANDARSVNFGISVFHPNQPSYSFYADRSQKLYMKMVFHGDASYGIKNTNMILKPSYMILIQGSAKEITPGLSVQYVLQDESKYTENKRPAAITLGGYYRVQDSFIAAAKFEYSNYSIGLSYDINISKLVTVSRARGGFEISLRFISPRLFGKHTASKS